MTVKDLVLHVSVLAWQHHSHQLYCKCCKYVIHSALWPLLSGDSSGRY